MDSIQQVFVAGAGQMGQGIAQVVASAGMNVHLYDLQEAPLQAALEKIRWSLEKLQAKGVITESSEAILSRITTTTNLTNASDADLIIEAVPEDESIKKGLFEKLDALVPTRALLTTNTSAIRISSLASATRRPDQFCGLHFFNPVPMMPLVEVVRAEQTSEATVARVSAFAERIGKRPVHVNGDRAGFIVNRILGAAMIEAMRILELGSATANDIDQAMRLGCGWKMGPLETADLAGLDVVMRMCDVMQVDNTDQVFAPPATLRELVAQGELGRKTGQGFYPYS